jgi:hypothetical protein
MRFLGRKPELIAAAYDLPAKANRANPGGIDIALCPAVPTIPRSLERL